jgi:small subunit ribosomal protein S5
MTKEEIENLNKTAKANKTISEEIAEAITEDMIEEEIDKEMVEEDEEKQELIKKEEEKKPFKHKRNFGPTKEELLLGWEPKTQLGKDVKAGKIKNIDEILDKKQKILEEQIVDSLVNLESDLISIGQSKGKFGGGKRRAWRQTQRKTREGNVATFSTMAVIGDLNGHVGIGDGKSTETLPARDKATRKAKLNIIKITRGCSSFDCDCKELHTVPFKVEGKEGSTRVILIPAPQGTGIVAANELKKILKMAGIKDVYTKTFGKARTSFNLIKACFNALKKTNKEKNDSNN